MFAKLAVVEVVDDRLVIIITGCWCSIPTLEDG